MPNMSYCRFQNTVRDLDDCYDHMRDELSEDEEAAKKELIATCSQIHLDYGNDNA